MMPRIIRFRQRSVLAPALCALLAVACSPPRDLRPDLNLDVWPPRLFSVAMAAPQELVLEFDKPVTVVADSLAVELFDETSADTDDDAPGIRVALDGESQVRLAFDRPTRPGIRYSVGAAVEDTRGNSLQLVAFAYGYNDRVPQLQINEFITRRSANHPEMAEVLVLSDGNLGGLTVTNGTKSDYIDRFIFPSVEVSAGEFILLHFRPEGAEHEISEFGDEIDLSGGLNAQDHARDIWIPGAAGLPGNNGVLAIWEHPAGPPVDAVAWTNRTSASDERYRGFGSARMESRVQELVDTGAWVIEGVRPRPEDLIWIDYSTATRSMNRSPGAANTRSATDWHTAPTRGSSWGEENTTEVHMP